MIFLRIGRSSIFCHGSPCLTTYSQSGLIPQPILLLPKDSWDFVKFPLVSHGSLRFLRGTNHFLRIPLICSPLNFHVRKLRARVVKYALHGVTELNYCSDQSLLLLPPTDASSLGPYIYVGELPRLEQKYICFKGVDADGNAGMVILTNPGTK